MNFAEHNFSGFPGGFAILARSRGHCPRAALMVTALDDIPAPAASCDAG
jgi:hypothetical protein